MIRMKIPSLYNSYHTPAIEDQVFAHKIDPLCCLGHQVLLYQGFPAIHTLLLGAAE